MSRHPAGLFVVSTVLVLILSLPAVAQWVEDGALISTSIFELCDPTAVPDGEGGAFIIYEKEVGGGIRIYAQRVDGNGNFLWPASGVALCSSTYDQFGNASCPDETGGIIVAWYENRTGDNDIFAQRINANGVIQYGGQGLNICKFEGAQLNPQVYRSGNGIIFAWRDNRNGNNDIYAQKTTLSGLELWTANGIPICMHSSNQETFQMAIDGESGAYFTWHDNRSADNDIYATRYDSTGSIHYYWSGNPSGTPVCSASGSQTSPAIIYDGEHGCIIAWTDARDSNSDIYVQRFDPYGASSWGSNGLPVCVDAESQYAVRLCSDRHGGAYLAWNDARNGWLLDIYAQRVSGAGTPRWAADGIVICSEDGYQSEAVIIEDGFDGMILTWHDSRYGLSDVYVQKVDEDGILQWPVEGAEVCVRSGRQRSATIVSDGDGGCLAFWLDNRSGLYDYGVYGQRIERYGYWGYPSVSISSARDLPGDQGGSITLSWVASRLDPWPDESIDHYSIWRAIGGGPAAAMLQRDAVLVDNVAEIDESITGPVVRREIIGASTFYWERIESNYPAEHLETYSYTASTLFDSTDVSDGYHYFQVITHGFYPDHYWISSPDSGRSVDNLAPAAPQGLAGEQAYTPEGLQLTWDPNSEADLAGYNIYRGLSSDFTPGPNSFVASTPDTAIFDGDWSWGTGYWYKVAAVDIHGNESLFAILAPDVVTGDDPMPLPDATFLSQNFPNPFNPVTTIAFGLKEQGHVTLSIYDAAGRLVAGLINESRPAGQYAAVWNGKDRNGTSVASGVYFYRLITNEFEQTKKMILLR